MYLCAKSFNLVIVFFFVFFLKKNKYFHFFPIVKFNANYAEICRVGNLEADFQQVPLVQFFPKFSQYCCKTSIIEIQQEKWKKKKKKKKMFLDKNSKNVT